MCFMAKICLSGRASFVADAGVILGQLIILRVVEYVNIRINAVFVGFQELSLLLVHFLL